MRPFPLILLFFFLFSSENSFSQNEHRLKLSFGYGTAYTLATVNGQRAFRPHRESELAAEGGWSQQWPLQSGETKLKSWENFLYNSQFSFGVEKSISNRFSLASGLEIGGRYFTVTEYRTRDGRGVGPVVEEYYANRMTRAYLVSSLPLLLKTSLNGQGKLQFLGITGFALNYAHSVGKTTVFYESKSISTFFPTLHLGLEIRERYFNRLSLDLGWQAGFSNILQDEVVLYSGLNTGSNVQRFQVESRGSHLRAGLHFYFNSPGGKKALPVSPGVLPIPPVGKTIQVSLQSGPFELCIVDDQTIDDDSVKVLHDKQVLVEAMRLTKSEQCYTLNLDSTAEESEILIIALNDGRIKPNTMRIVIRQNGKEVENAFIRTETTRSVQLLIRKTP